ncbi:MAG: class I tRNA ligase family protein [Patescibacteria group bacterium]
MYAHGFLSLAGNKISKTLGNVIRPTELVEKFGVDPIRYYLIKFGPQREDADISDEKIKETYNADLANGLGNLVSRVAKLAEGRNLDSLDKLASTGSSNDLRVFIEKFHFDEALGYIWKGLKQLDAYINMNKPWEAKGEALDKHLIFLVPQLLEHAALLEPFLPETAERIRKQFTGKIKPAAPLFPRFQS